MSDFLLSIPGGVWALVVTPIVMGFMFIESKKKMRRDQEGWVNLTPGISLYVIGLLSLLLLLVFMTAPFAAMTNEENSASGIVTLFLLSAMTWPLIGYGAYYVFIVRTRFNNSGIEYQSWRGREFYPWNDIIEVVDSVWLGSFLRTKHKKLRVWKYLRGFPQLLKALEERNIKIDEDLYSF